MLNNEDIRYLENHLPFYNDLDKAEKQYLSSSADFLCYPKLTLLKSGSEDCSGLFLVKKGQIRAYIVSESGKELTVFRLFNYDMCLFSATCIFRNIQFSLEVEAFPGTEVYQIPSFVFERLQKDNRKVLEFTNEIMSSRLSDVMWVIEQTLFKSFDKRLAAFLLEQMAIEGKILKITHEKIANHLASAREVVSRMLKYFQSEGMVTLGRGTIEIANREKLKQLSDE